MSQPQSVGPILDATAVDRDWLRDFFGSPVSGGEEIVVRSISHSAGDMGEVYRVSCGDRSIVLKGPPRDPDLWEGLVAESALVERELEVYGLLEKLGARARVAPECYWSGLDGDGRGSLALEDLGPSPPLAEVMATGLDRAQAGAALESLAVVHASCAVLGGDPLAAPSPWLYTAGSELLAAWIRWGIEDLPRLLAEGWPEGLAGAAVGAVVGADLDALVAESHLGAHLSALCHGDAWAGNVLFPPPAEPERGERAFLIDWQFAMWGNPMSDVALLLASSLEPPARAAWETELVGRYHAALVGQGGLEYPLSACWEDLRRAEPFAAAVALATLEAYTSGMSGEQLSRFAPRVSAAMRRVADWDLAGGAG